MPTTLKDRSQRENVRTRIRNFYSHFGKQEWRKCYEFIDPKLKDGKVDYQTYVQSLAAFFETYGSIKLLRIENLKVFADVKNNKHDDRDFAYGLLLWQDRDHNSHLLRERWVKDGDRWYTRMAGLATHSR